MSGRSPLHGYNTNYRREGNLYHVQTEDLGENSAAIVTQVFIGGTILATERTEYRHLLVEPEQDLLPMLQRLMQKQHKKVLIGLRDGTLEMSGDPASQNEDGARGREGGRDTVQMELPPDFLEELEQELKFDEDSDETLMVDSVQLVAESVVGVEADLEDERDAEPRESDIPLVDIDMLAPTPPPIAASERFRDSKRLTAPTRPPPPPPQTGTPLPPPPPPEELVAEASDIVSESPLPIVANMSDIVLDGPLPLDMGDIEEEIPEEEEEATQRVSQIADIPLAVPVKEPASASPPPRRRISSVSPLPSRASPLPTRADGKEQELDSQAPKIFTEVSRPAPGFGEDQLGERSLDEVILSYLAEELQEDS